VKEKDPVPDVVDVRRHVAETLARFSSQRPIASIVVQTPQEVQVALSEYCARVGARIQ